MIAVNLKSSCERNIGACAANVTARSVIGACPDGDLRFIHEARCRHAGRLKAAPYFVPQTSLLSAIEASQRQLMTTGNLLKAGTIAVVGVTRSSTS